MKRLRLLSRIFALILSALLLPPFAAEANETELVINGGFEEYSAGIPTGWTGVPFDSGDGSTASVTTEKSYTGSACVKLTSEGNTIPSARQQVSRLIPGATYVIKFNLWSELGADADEGAGIKLEYYKGASASSGAVGSGNKKYTGSTNGRWTELTYEFQLPETATMCKIYCRLYSDGVAYFDDVSLKMKEVEKFSFYGSDVFHYSDDTQGTVIVTMHSFYAGTGLEESSRADFLLYDGEELLEKVVNMPFSDGRAIYTYNVQKLKDEGKQYKLYAKVHDLSGNMISEYSQSLYKYDRPKYLDSNGNYIDENNTIIEPYIAYHCGPDYYDKAVEAGINMVQLGYGIAPVVNVAQRTKTLQALEDNNLKGIFCLYLNMEAACSPGNIENTKKIVDMYKDDPRIFAWAVQDEPLGAGITEEKKELLESSYKTIRDIDSKHPILLTDYSPFAYPETIKYCDVFISNAYGKTLAGVTGYTEYAVGYAGKKPVYINVCAYGTTPASLPSGDTLQHCIYQALAAGARGISLYCFTDCITEPVTPIWKTQLWDPLLDFNRTERESAYRLLINNKNYTDLKTADYLQRKWETDEGTYYFLMSLNNTQSRQLSYSLSSGKCVQLLAGNTTDYFNIAGSVVYVTLQAGDVLMFLISDKSGKVRLTKNGIGIKGLEKGVIKVEGEGASKYAVASYEIKNGKKILTGITFGRNISLTITEDNIDKKFEVYAWRDNLAPVGSKIKH